MELKFNDLKQLLPHRYPFLLVDRVLDLKNGFYAIGIKNIIYDDPYNDNLEGKQYYPPELVIESLGQLTAILYIISNNATNREFILGSIKGISVFQKIPANEQIRMEVNVSHMTDSYAIASGKAFAENNSLILTIEEFICKINPINV